MNESSARELGRGRMGRSGIRAWALGFALLGCGRGSPDASEAGEGESDTEPTTEPSGGESMSGSETGTATDTASETDDSVTTNPTSSFGPPGPDQGFPPSCDVLMQDCPEGEKCVPYASSGEVWDTYKCVLVQGEQGEGEMCSYGGAVEAIDDCDEQSYCWDANQEGTGTCRAFCTGTWDEPSCPPEFDCLLDEGIPALCLPT